jgi:hypothetical protein
MTISVYAVSHPSRQYEVGMPKPTVHDLVHRDALAGKFNGFDRLDVKWYELIELALTGKEMISVEGRAYTFESLNTATGQFKLKPM